VTITIKGLDNFQKSLGKLSKQMDYALTLTVNDLAFDSKSSLENEIKHGMNVRVNTAKAFAVEKANKSNITAVVRIKDDWHKDAIPHHYKGGTGTSIVFERGMIRRGYMTKGNSAIPVKKMGKAKYRSLLKETRRGVKSKTFVVPVGNKSKRTSHLEPGIYTRLKRKVKPVMIFTQEAKYKKRFDMRITVGKVVKRRAQSFFYKNMTKALRTAR